MGYMDDNRERLARPHWYVALCDDQEIGSAPTEKEAKQIVAAHLLRHKPRQMQRTPQGLVLEIHPHRYTIRKLKTPRLSPDHDLPVPQRRHG